MIVLCPSFWHLYHLPLDVRLTLTLTVASRAYLIEPIGQYCYRDREDISDFFPGLMQGLLTTRNPTLEYQALVRFLRIGQTREVTTIRFFIRDPFEKLSPQQNSPANTKSQVC